MPEIEFYNSEGTLVASLVPDPSLETVISDSPESTVVEEVLVNELVPVEEREPVERRIVTRWKAGSAPANEQSLRDRLDAMKDELRAAMDADRALRDRAQAARQAIPNQASTTIPILRTALLEQLAIEIDAGNARIATNRAILNITRLLDGDFSQGAE